MSEHQNITAALAAFHQTVGTIEKAAKAQYGHFADLSTVLSAITPALSKHGLALVQSFDVGQNGDTLLVSTLLHTSGERLESRVPLVRVEASGGRQNPLHLWGGSVTYQRRYAALALVGLAAGMEDDDGDIATPQQAQPKRVITPKPATPAPAAEPFDLPEEAIAAIKHANTEQALRDVGERVRVSGFRGDDAVAIREGYTARLAELRNPMVDA